MLLSVSCPFLLRALRFLVVPAPLTCAAHGTTQTFFSVSMSWISATGRIAGGRRSSYFFEYLFDDAFGFNGVSVFPYVFVVCWWCLQWYDSRMWILRLPEQHRFSTRPIVLPIFYVCYLQHWIRFYVVRTEISLALPCRVHRHSLFSALTVYLMGHTAVQSSVAEGFCLNRQRCLQSQLKWLTRSPITPVAQCKSYSYMFRCDFGVPYDLRRVVNCIRPSRS